MGLDPLCICIISVCIITCWRCFLPLRLALPIMPYPLYIVTLNTKIEDSKTSGERKESDASEKSLHPKASSDDKGSITEKTPILFNTRKCSDCFSDSKDLSKGDYSNYYTDCKRQYRKYGSINNMEEIFYHSEVSGELIEFKTEEKYKNITKIATYFETGANIERHSNTRSDTKKYCLSGEIKDSIEASTNKCSSSTETLVNSRNRKRNCAINWMRSKKPGLHDIVSRSRNFLKKYTHKAFSWHVFKKRSITN